MVATEFDQEAQALADAEPVITLLSVHQAIANVIRHLPAIGKDQQMSDNSSGNYKYRGVEQIKNAIKRAMVAEGVHYAPHEIVEVVDEPYQVRSGATWQRCRLLVRWRFYGPLGDYVEAMTRGEGADNGDKASNKAMTAAEKYALIQVFAISDGGADDGDDSRPEEAVPAVVLWTLADAKRAVLEACMGDSQQAKAQWVLHVPATETGPFTKDRVDEIVAAVTTELEATFEAKS